MIARRLKRSLALFGAVLLLAGAVPVAGRTQGTDDLAALLDHLEQRDLPEVQEGLSPEP